MADSSKESSVDQVVVSDPAIRSITAHLIFWLVAGLSLWLDLWSKSWAFANLPIDGAKPFLGGWIEFRRSLNDGAVFGSFTGYTSVFIVASLFALAFVFYLFAHSDRRHWGLHIALALILSGAIGNLYDRAYVIADVAKITDDSGTIRTMIGKLLSKPEDDPVLMGSWPSGSNPKRLSRERYSVILHEQGVVRDFIKFVPRFPDWVPKLAGREVWPWVFNIADAALVCGVGALLLSCMFDGKRAQKGAN